MPVALMVECPMHACNLLLLLERVTEVDYHTFPSEL